MEALVAVGLASNILQFVDFAKSIVSDTKKFYETTSGAKDEYQEAEDYAQRLQRLAAQLTMPQAPYDGDISLEDKELKELGERCSQIANELLVATRDVTATSHNDWVQSAKRAIKARLSSSQIKSLQTRLDRINQQLTGKLLHAQLENTERTLSGMAAESRRLSSRRDEDIHHLQEQLQHVTTLLEKGKGQRYAAISLAGIAETGAQLSAEQLILGRLFFHGMNERHTNVHLEHEQTLSWIFESNSPVRFSEFLEGEGSLYWVSGKPGSGKSTAMKYICQHPETKRRLEQWANGSRLIVAKFFFWNAGKSSQLKSQEGLLQSILYQIFHETPALIPHAFPEDWTAYLSGNPITSSSKAGSFSIAQLLSAIQLLCAHLSELQIKICIFVDGLDEYDGRPGDVIRLIEALKTSTNIKSCVSSRPWNEFERAFGQDEEKKLYMQDLTKSDIRKYVRDTLENDEIFRELVNCEEEESSMLLVHDIVDAAQGVFLWVILVVRSLLEGLTNADTFSNLQRRLRSLPTDLDEYFERILFSVDDFYGGQAAAMCLVTLSAARRLPLMSYWFMDQESSSYALDMRVQPMELRLIHSRLDTMKKRLNACCKGLLETTYDDPESNDGAGLMRAFFVLKVDFLHRTVRDFLRIPQTQHRLLDRLPKGFNPEITICRALLAQIKASSHEMEFLLASETFEDLLKTFFLHAGALEDERIPVQTEMVLVDAVASTLQTQAKPTNKNIEPYLNEYFLSSCVESGLLRYIYKMLEREQNPHSSHDLSILLRRTNWGVRHSSWGESQEHGIEWQVRGLWNESQLQLIRCLFRAEADPNYASNNSEETPWKVFLDVIGEVGFPDDEGARVVAFSILEEYIKNGATLQSVARGFHGGPSDYKRMLKKRMTEDQFDALLRLTDSKRNYRDRLVSGLKRILGLWKVPKKIGSHW